MTEYMEAYVEAEKILQELANEPVNAKDLPSVDMRMVQRADRVGERKY